MHPVVKSTLLRGPGKALALSSTAEEEVTNKGDVPREIMGTSWHRTSSF